MVNISTTQAVEQGAADRGVRGVLPGVLRAPRRQRRLQRRRQNSLGSGFIIDPSGYIVTNHHVIAEADEISVRLVRRHHLGATLVGSDEKTDLALLKVESDKPLPATNWGRFDKPGSAIG